MSNAALPDVKEADATGHIADIYDEIRRALGVPMVNLIFRHMATIPGCLEWVWATIGPVYTSGLVLRAAEQGVTAQSPLAMNFGSSITSWDADMMAVRATCAAYIRANPANVVGLLALQMILTESQDARAARPAPQKPREHVTQPAPAALPPMGDMERLDARTIKVLMALTAQLHGNDGRVIPSFYRHFTQWPLLLESVHVEVQRLVDTGILTREAMNMQRRIQSLTTAVYRACPRTELPEPPEHVRSKLIELIELFPPNICKMTLIARAIGAALESKKEQV
jgi:hypothetical protein